jgi:hypothetical protein
MMTRWGACRASRLLRTGCRVPIGAGRTLRDGMTAQRASALGPKPAWTGCLVAA